MLPRMVWFLHRDVFLRRCWKFGYSDRSVTFKDMCAEEDEQLVADLLTILITNTTECYHNTRQRHNDTI